MLPHFTCCGISFDGEAGYVEHRQAIHGEEPVVRHTCCGIRFQTEAGYAEHRAQIHGETAPAGARGLFARLFRRSEPSGRS